MQAKRTFLLMHITTLIPAYKTKYMVELLTGLVTQTAPSQRVIVSDDSPSGEFGAILRSEAMKLARERLPIEIHEGPRLGAYPNVLRLLDLWGESTELVHLLLDDDVIYPDFYATHLQMHREGGLSCSISARWNANERGQPIEGMPVPPGIRAAPQRFLRLDATAMFSTTVPLCQNWFGEFSNCVLSPAAARLLREPVFAGVSYAGLWDLGAFLAASLQAPVAYCQDRLGAFRTGGSGHSGDMNGKFMKAAHLGYCALALGGQRLGVLGDEHARQCYVGIALALQQRYQEQPEMQPFVAPLLALSRGEPAAEAFLALWQDFLRRHDF